MSKQQSMKQYEVAYSKKDKLGPISKAFQQYLLYMEYTIKNQTRSFSILSICGGEEKNRFILDKRFPKAYQSMNLSQKVKHYEKSIQFALKGIQERKQANKKFNFKENQPEKSKQEIKIHLLFPKRFNSYEDVLVTIKDYKIVCGSYNLDARNFLLRTSNKKDRKCMALEAIHNIQPETLRFSFRTTQEQRQFLPLIVNLFDKAHEENVIKMSQVAKINRHTQIFKLLTRQHQNQEISSPEKNLAKHFTEFLKNHEGSQASNANLKINSNTKIISERQKDNESSEHFAKNQSIVQQIMKQSFIQQDEDVPSTQILGRMMDLDQQKAIQALNQKNKHRFKKNLFQLMLPNFSLSDLDYLTSYISVFSCYTDKIYIYKHCNNNKRFRMELSTKLDPQILLKAIFNIQLYKAWHPEVNEGSVRIRLTSQNSAIVYQKHKRYSEWYRQRDFLFLRHLFKINKDYYIVDKAITNAMFFPFQSITRGIIEYAVWRVNPTEKGSLLIMQILINHEGLLNEKQHQDLTLRYLKGFSFLQKYFSRIDTEVNLNDYFGFNWEINPRLQQSRLSSLISNDNQGSLHSVDFYQQKSVISRLSQSEDLQDFYTVKSNDDEENLVQSQVQIQNIQMVSSKKNNQLNKSKHEIEPHFGDMESVSTLMKFQQEQIKLNEQGLAILPNTYLNKKHIVSPIANAHHSFAPKIFPHSLLKNDWQMMPKGGLRLIHQQKIKAQNNVFKFLLKKIGSNLLSGKGATGVSLPVQIFNIDSNLQRDCFIMATAPNYLEKAFKCTKGVDRFKDVITFGFTTMYLFLDPEKPFNPILGETYQGFIAGCPIYAQQISHHPPITSIYMVGRGYKIHANFQTKVAIHMNSADGINQGFCNMVFDDGQKILFQTPIGQLSGLNYGDRTFNFKGKAYYLDESNRIYAQIRFQQAKGYFSKSKWKYVDQLEGQVTKVTPQFVDKFMQAPNLKKPSPQKSQTLQKFHQISGRWTQQILYDQEVIIRASQISPYQLKDYEFPLNSNSNYREDIIYRKKLDISRSQLEKERLEVAQRADRKLRQGHNA